MVQWVAERVWWIGGTVVVCFALAVTASTWLERACRAPRAAWGAARGIYSRADVILPYRAERIREPLADPGRRALPAPQITVNIFGMPTTGQAAIIRQALPGTAGDAITEGRQP